MSGHIRERGTGRWLIQWYLGRNAAGKKRYRTKTIRGSKRDAERELRRILRERDQGIEVGASRTKLDEHLDRWLEAERNRVSGRTWEGYRSLTVKHVKPHLGGRRLDELKLDDVQGWVNELSRSYAPRTVRLAFTMLNKALKVALKRGAIGVNPAALVDLPRKARKTAQTLSAAQMAKLREVLPGSPQGALIEFLAFTGMRPQEARALRWRDVDLDAALATVTRAATKDEKGCSVVGPTKTAAGSRAVPLPPFLVGSLRRHRAWQARQALSVGPAYRRDLELVFANEIGELVNHRNLGRRFETVLKRAGLPRVRLYDLRHSHATLLAASGEHPEVVRERLGHSQSTTTLKTYTHAWKGMQEGVVAKLEAEFGSGNDK